jgi:hypothetical protein
MRKSLRGRGEPAHDPGLAQIDALERDMVLAKVQTWEWNGVSAEEIARYKPDLIALARNVTDRLRAEYLVRRQP